MPLERNVWRMMVLAFLAFVFSRMLQPLPLPGLIPMFQSNYGTLYDIRPLEVPYSPYNATGNIPRQIFIFWDTGFPTPNPSANLARRSWEYMNPTYRVRALNMQLAEALSNRSHFIADDLWNKISIQAKSDVYRTLLLHLHGGIWADASAVCNQPLDDWIDLNQTDLIAFLRHDNPEEGRIQRIWPWVASWFLAAPQGSYFTRRLVDQIRVQTNPRFFRRLYYWWHHTLSNLAHSDAYINNRISNVFTSADANHCRYENWQRSATVMKRCEELGAVGFRVTHAAFATTQLCCGNPYFDISNPEAQQQQRSVEPIWVIELLSVKAPTATKAWMQQHCPSWDCHNIAVNLHRVDDMEQLYGKEMFDALIGGEYT